MTGTSKSSTRRLRQLAGLAFVGLSAAILVTGSSPALGFTSTIRNVHRWLPDWHHSVVNTRSEAITVAQRYNVVVGQSKVYKPWLRAMHAARHRVVVASYKSSISAGGENYMFVSRNHPGWFLRDRYGNRLHDSYGAYLINPKSDGVRTWTVALARRAQRDGFDAFFLDSLGTYGLEAFHGTPIDPATGRAFTPSTWLVATRGLAKRVNAAVRIPVIGNGLRDGATYYSSPGTFHLLDVLQAGEFEACFRAATFSAGWYPSPKSWLQQVKAISSVQRRGKRALCWTKIYSSATSAQRQHWFDFARASFLLAQHGRAYFYFQGSSSDNALSASRGRLRIGRPVTGRRVSGVLQYRRFSNGIVVVNPTGASTSMRFRAPYLLGGNAVRSLHLAAHTGVVLVSP